MAKFTIKVRFHKGLTKAQKRVFKKAAARWQELIVGDLPRVRVRGEIIEDVLIEAKGADLGGRGGTLGQAGPTWLRPDTLLPAMGIMEFDIADLQAMEDEGTLQSVIVHEMGHVLGLGTIWQGKELLDGAGTANPIFTGRRASKEFAKLLKTSGSTPVPVENRGGPGTRDGHWRERVFGNEIMTGFLSGDMQPFSRMTIASLEDLGYKANKSAGDRYKLPTTLQLAMMGVGADEANVRRCSHSDKRFKRPKPKVLPKSALV